MTNEWKRVKPTEVTKVGWRTIITKHFELPDGRTEDFQLYGGKDTACVIALTKDKQVITVLQFRPGPEKIMHEIPGGFVDEEGGNPEDAAIRELSEETGYKAGNVIYLGAICSDAYSTVNRHYYLAENCEFTPNTQELSGTEFVDIKLISIDTFLHNARLGLMTDTPAVFLAYERLKELSS